MEIFKIENFVIILIREEIDLKINWSSYFCCYWLLSDFTLGSFSFGFCVASFCSSFIKCYLLFTYISRWSCKVRTSSILSDSEGTYAKIFSNILGQLILNQSSLWLFLFFFFLASCLCLRRHNAEVEVALIMLFQNFNFVVLVDVALESVRMDLLWTFFF